MFLLDYLGILIFTTIASAYGVFCYVHAESHETAPSLSTRREGWVFIKAAVVGGMLWLVSTTYLFHQQDRIKVSEQGFRAAWLRDCQGDVSVCGLLYDRARMKFHE